MLGAKERDFALAETKLTNELVAEKAGAQRLTEGLQSKIEDGLAEIERIRTNLRASDIEIGGEFSSVLGPESEMRHCVCVRTW